MYNIGHSLFCFSTLVAQEIFMLALLQRVNYARIVVEGECIADMKKVVLAFIAFERGDTLDKAKKCLIKF